MTLKVRRVLYILFILIFLTITPIVSFYAAGYKIGNGFNLQKTGILIVDSEPTGAKIYINDKLQQKFFTKYFNQEKSYITTPAKIKNILPGEYYIKVEKDNYWLWEKKLTINSGQSTFAEDIYLFKKDMPTIVSNGAFEKISTSPDKKHLIAIGNQNAIIINLTNDKIIELKLDKEYSGNTNCIWSPNNEKIIINNLIISINNQNNQIDIDKMIGKNISNIKWNNNDEILYTDNNTINLYNLSSKASKTLIQKKEFSDFISINNQLLFFSQSNNTTNLVVWDINENKEIKSINLPSASYTFVNPEHKLINAYDNNHNILYLIDPVTPIKPIRETISNVKKTYWVNENTLLYANNFEIWMLNLENLNKTLLTRISEEITEIIWHSSNNYVIYSTDKTINIIELDNREKRNITEILKINNIEFLTLNTKGDILYFYGSLGNQEGVYKLFIQ